MQKLENETPITLVNWQLNDSSFKIDVILVKAALSCC